MIVPEWEHFQIVASRQDADVWGCNLMLVLAEYDNGLHEMGQLRWMAARLSSRNRLDGFKNILHKYMSSDRTASQIWLCSAFDLSTSNDDLADL